MKTKQNLLISLAVVAAITLAYGWFTIKPAQADHIPGETNQVEGYEKVDRYVEEQLKALNIPGAAMAIIEGDQIVHVRGFGVSGPEGQAPTPQTPFFICSLSKSFTALAIMQLVEVGKIELDAPIQRYLPWFAVTDPQASGQITVRHLLNQTSGFTMASGWKMLQNFDDSPDATEKQARELSNFKLDRPVSAAFEYSNTNYNLLGLIIESASGEKYADYVQHHIFEPVGMKKTYTSKTVAKQNGMGTGYISWFGFPLAVAKPQFPNGSLPAGGIISTTEDIAHYLITILNEKSFGGAQLLSSEGIATLHTPAVDATTMGTEMFYGMGWFIEKTTDGGSILISHDGTCPDYKGYMALLPDQKKGMVLLLNANELMIDFSWKYIGGWAASLLAGAQPQAFPWVMIPWSLRALLIIPVLQILSVFLTLRTVRRWRSDASSRPGTIRKWIHVVLPSIPDLILVCCALYFVTSGLLHFWMLYMADVSTLALFCGSFALVWIFVRTRLILSALNMQTTVKSPDWLEAEQVGT